MTLAQLRNGALLRYGLNPYEGEDPVLLIPLVNDLVNEAHRWAAQDARLYRQTFTTNLVISSAGVSTVSLDETVYQVDSDSGAVRVLNGSTWQEPELTSEEAIIGMYGPVENAATVAVPEYYWPSTGSADSLQRQLVFYPGASAAITNGLKYAAWTYPAPMTAETDRPELPASEHDLLIPLICFKMAQVMAGQGDARPLSVWQAPAERALLDLRSRMADHRRGTDRRGIHYLGEGSYC